jgi:hypothetical protein
MIQAVAALKIVPIAEPTWSDPSLDPLGRAEVY